MPGQIPEQIKTERSHRLLELDERRRREYMESFLGEEKEVLLEEQVLLDGESFWSGHTREYLKVLVPAGKEDRTNQMVHVRLEKILNREAVLGTEKD